MKLHNLESSNRKKKKEQGLVALPSIGKRCVSERNLKGKNKLGSGYNQQWIQQLNPLMRHKWVEQLDSPTFEHHCKCMMVLLHVSLVWTSDGKLTT